MERYQDSPGESSEEGGFNALWFWPNSSGRALWLLGQSGETGNALEAPGGRTTTRRTTLKADAWTDAAMALERRAVERRARPGDCPAFS
jgi:hypothetical protein